MVVVEAPTYDRTLLSLTKLGAEILAIPLEADGIDVGALAAALEEGARPVLAHIIPNFQNPAGCTLSLEKRHRLLELAQRVRVHDLRGRPLRRAALRGRAAPDDARAVRAATSRSCTPRRSRRPSPPASASATWSATEELIAAIRKRATETYISPNMVAQSIVAEFCDSGALDRSIATVKQALRERRDATCAALDRHLPDARYVTPEGGYFLWVDLPEGTDVAELARGAAERGVVFEQGRAFMIEGGESSLRLAYSAVPPDQIEEGIARIAEAYRELASPRACVIELERPRDARALLRDSLVVYLRHFWTFLALGALVVVPTELIVGGIGLEQFSSGYDSSPRVRRRDRSRRPSPTSWSRR